MIDLTPLDVRNKRGDFKKLLRGYDPHEVDVFLEIVAERLEVIVRENIQLRERSETLERQVSSQSGREHAVQEALVSAQELRADIKGQAQRESDHLLKEAETEARRLIAEAGAEVRKQIRDAERKLQMGQDSLEEMERRRTRFLKAFRQLLEREMDVVEVEQERPPLEDRAIDMDLGGGRFDRPDVAVTEFATDDDPIDRAPQDDSTEPPQLDASIDQLAADFGGAESGDVELGVPGGLHDTDNPQADVSFKTLEAPEAGWSGPKDDTLAFLSDSDESDPEGGRQS